MFVSIKSKCDSIYKIYNINIFNQTPKNQCRSSFRQDYPLTYLLPALRGVKCLKFLN